MATKKAVIATTATEAIRILWQEKFFTNWKKKASIEQGLAKKGNHFSDAELGMALKRAKHLTRRGNRGSYEYIQKYPFLTEEAASSKKKAKARGSK